MGFFSKIFKGVKKVFKKIGKGIKGAFKKFGKFMNKIGILGQIAMFFILPGVGQALGSMWTGIAGQTAAQGAAAATAASTAATAGATAAGATASAAATAGATAAAGVSTAASGLMAGGAVSQAVGSAMRFVGSAVSKVGTVFNNVTQGITETLGNFAKTASNKLFGTSFDAAANFFGPGDSAFGRSFGESSRISNITQSKDFFEARDTVRANNFKISQTEKALNTPKGQKAMADTVAEGYGNDGFGFDSEYSKNIQANIDAGNTNLTASLDPNYVPDPQALAQQQAKELALGPNLTGPENFSRIEIPSDPTLQMSALDAGVTTVDAPSLLERLKTGVKGIPDAVYKKAGEIADDPLGYAFKGTEESLQQQMNLRVGQELGISEKPEYIQNYVSNNAYVPSFESFGGAQQQYGAPEIMDARAFEQQVTFNPNPYGYTAFQYGNYMSQFGQTA